MLIDDLGFAGTSTFGGPVATPSFDRIAKEGLRYNNFHTTAVCSPTRAALTSGRNHHVNNMGGIIETGTAFPGNTGQIPNEVAPVAEMLRLNGYATAAFGKWHEAAAWIKYQKALTPDRPFFVYYAPGAVHAPHHVPKEWSDR